jgi:MerR family redox-sensitive transcriptional activator SoxR
MPRGHTSFHEWSVGQVAQRSGISISALHFYEREGLILSARNSGNQRRYGRDTLRRLAFIRASQRVGIPLASIRQALDELPQQRTPREDDWAAVAIRWRAVLDDQLQQLERLRDDLTTCIGCGCLSFQRCLLVNPADAMSHEGPGPRRLLPGTPRPEPVGPISALGDLDRERP